MLKRTFLATLTIAPALLFTAPAAFADDVHCSFQMGFATIAGAITDTVGGCLTQPVGLENGDVVQQTTRGQMIWYQSTNIPEFVDQQNGITWVLGPQGLQSRPSNQPFSYETPATQVAGVTITSQGPSQGSTNCVANAVKADGIPHPVAISVQLPFSNAAC